MIRRLLLLNGVSVLGAVVNHASGWGFTALFWWTDRYQPGQVPNFSQVGSASYYMLRVAEQLIMFSVPAFLFVSGFFVAVATGRQQHTVSWDVVTKRVKFFALPYVFWSAAIFVLHGIEGRVGTPWEYARQLLVGSAAAPFFYIPLLIQLYLLSPFIVRMVKRHWKATLLIAGLLQLTVRAAQYPVLIGAASPVSEWIVRLTPGWFVPQTIFWFVFGVFAGFHPTELKLWLARYRWVLAGATIVCWALALIEWELLYRMSGQWLPPRVTVLDNLFSLGFILAFMAFERSTIPMSRQLSELATKSFGVYLMHAPVLEIAARSVYHVAPWVLPYQLPFQLLLVTVGLAVPLAGMALVNRSPARPCYQYVFG